MAGFIDAIKRSYTGGDQYDKMAKNLQKQFIQEMNQMADQPGNLPKLASMDMKYNYFMQKRRAERHGITLRHRYHLEEEYAQGVSALMGKDQRYITRIPVLVCKSERAYFMGQKKLREIRSQETICSYTVFTEHQDINASYCCPNCGDVNSVRQLLEQGCRSCQTRFVMSDLYPRITNSYTMKEKSYSRTRPLPFLLIGILTGLILFFTVTSHLLEKDQNDWVNYFVGISGTAFGGLVMGLLIYAVTMIVLLIVDAARSGSRVSAFNQTRNKLPPLMQRYDPYFSVDFFAGKVNQLLKTLVYTDDYDNCSVYEKGGSNICPDIVDLDYQGVMGLNDFSSDGRYVFVDVDVYARSACVTNQKFRMKDEIFRMKLCRSVMVYDDCNASVHHIVCASCGASFDAVRQKKCPYCHSPYALRNYDWVVTEFERK